MLLIEEPCRAVFARLGLDSFAAVSAHFGMDELTSRTMVRIKPAVLESPDGPPLDVFFKQYDYQPASFGFVARPSKALCEFRNYEAFARLGIACAQRLACGEQRDALGRLRRAFILTRAVPGAANLIEFTAAHCASRSTNAARELRRAVRRELAGMTRRLHDGGFFHNDLYWRNVLVSWQPPAEPKVSWIDCPRGQFDRWSPWRRRRRLKDLASLDKSASRHCSRGERLAFVKEYLGRTKLDAEVKQLIRDTLAYRKRRWPESGMKTETLDQGRITVSAGYLPLLRANGLDAFDKMMSLAGGRVARNFPGRRTVRIELKDADGAAAGFYLKRYESNYLSALRRAFRVLRWPGAEDEAWREWRMLHEVRAAGVPTAVPVAAGWDGVEGRATRSFLMTAEIAGAVEGQVWMRQTDAAGRRNFMLRVAEMARRFHHAGFVHKDFYVGHVLVAPGRAGAEPGLFLIDLQRVMKPRRFRTRWLLKDLGAMAYSLLNAGATRSGLMRAYLGYAGCKRLGPVEKSFARQAMKRVAWLRTRRPKHDG